MLARFFPSFLLVLAVACPAPAWVTAFFPSDLRGIARVFTAAGRSVEDEVEGVDEVDTAPPPAPPTPPAPTITPTPTPAPAVQPVPVPPPAIEPAPQPVVTPTPPPTPTPKKRHSYYKYRMGYRMTDLWDPVPYGLPDTEREESIQSYSMRFYFRKVNASDGPMELQPLLQCIGYFQFGMAQSEVWQTEGWPVDDQKGDGANVALCLSLGDNVTVTAEHTRLSYDEREDWLWWPKGDDFQDDFKDIGCLSLKYVYRSPKASLIVDAGWNHVEHETEVRRMWMTSWDDDAYFWADGGMRVLFFKERVGLGYEEHWCPGDPDWLGAGRTCTADLYMGTKFSIGVGLRAFDRNIDGSGDQVVFVRASLNLGHVLGVTFTSEEKQSGGDNWMRQVVSAFLRW